MAKVSGVGAMLVIDEFDVSGDIGALSSMSITTNLQDVSSIEDDGTARIPLRNDAEMSYSAFWNTAAGRSVAVLEPLEQAMATFARRKALGAPTRTLAGVKSTWVPTRGEDGSLVATGQLQASIGRPIEGGYLLTIGKQAFAATQAIAAWQADTAYTEGDLVQPTTPNGHYYSATTSGTSDDTTEPTWPTNGSTVTDDGTEWQDEGLLPNGIDRGSGSSSSFGMAAALHAISIGSSSATVKVQGSTDRVAWSDLLTFATVSAAGAEYKRTALDATIPRYLRVNVTGGFADLVAVVTAIPYRSQQH